MGECYEYLAGFEEVQARGGIGAVRMRITQLNDISFETMGVSPLRWGPILARVAHEFELPLLAQKRGEEILSNIYSTPVQLFEGVRETIKWFQDQSIVTGVITHANQEWTRKKFGWSELHMTMPWEWVYVVNEDGQKTSQEWGAAIRHFGFNPNQVICAGDSPRSDIKASWEAGVRMAFLVSGGVGGEDGWKVHKSEVDSKTRRIKSVADLIDYRG
jgi:phosphoglycolate phosphatase-like HAD superfamily hydrolase